MSDITFPCTHCGQHIAIDDSACGAQVKCPTCQGDLMVPNRSARQPAGRVRTLPVLAAALFSILLVGAAIWFSTTRGGRQHMAPVGPPQVNLVGPSAAPGSQTTNSRGSVVPASNSQQPAPPPLAAQRLTLSKTAGDGTIEYRLSGLERLASNEVAAVYFFLSRTNGPSLTQSLFVTPLRDATYRRPITVTLDGIATYEGEVVQIESEERVGYRYFRINPSRWDERDNGKTVRLCFGSFSRDAGKPDWEWFGPQAKVSAVIVALHENDSITHPVFSRFLEQPTEATFQTKLLMADAPWQDGWTLSNERGATTNAPITKPNSGDPEVLKRLMERRKRELGER